MKLLRLITFAFVFCYNPVSHAELYFSPSLFYKFYEEGTAGSKTETTETYYDIRLGYGMTSGLYFGGLYSGMTREINNSEFTRSSYGAGIGYVSDGWFLMGHYIIKSEYEVGSNAKYTDGTGFQGDLGYWFKAFSQLSIGPQITYRTIAYDKLKVGSASAESDFEMKEFLPYVSLALIF